MHQCSKLHIARGRFTAAGVLRYQCRKLHIERGRLTAAGVLRYYSRKLHIEREDSLLLENWLVLMDPGTRLKFSKMAVELF